MAQWDKIGSRGNVTDRRGSRMVGLGGLGVTGILIALLASYLGGGDLTDVISQLENVQVQTQPLNTQEFEGADNYEVFVSTVLGSNNDMWTNVFAQKNLTYNPPQLVLFRQLTSSSCGNASSQVGPHYCPLDKTIYIDETFFDELQTRFKAQGGDVAEAYVIAHEVGHHVQNELGILETNGSNEDSIRTELQADCFAGLWAHSIKNAGVFEEGEINEALDAASAVGDDRIQETIEGRITPENWTHGSSADRVQWFNRGFNSGLIDQCVVT
jgi:predicted metalloprotease